MRTRTRGADANAKLKAESRKPKAQRPHPDRDEGVTLFRQGDKGDSFYIVLSGAVDVIIHFTSATGEVEDKIVATLKDGSSFGELALVKSQPRNATIRTNTRCELFRMDRAAYIRVLKSFHEEKHRWVVLLGMGAKAGNRSWNLND